MKKADFMIISITLMTALGIWLFFQWQQTNQDNILRAVVKVDGKVMTQIELDAVTSASYTVKTTLGYNKVVIDQNKVYIAESDCTNQLCVHHAPIQYLGQSIVCLPHHLVVEILGKSKKKDSGVDAISH